MIAASLHVALVQPAIHWNTGNAGRTCLAAGAQLHLIEPLGFSLAEAEVRRAGLDYWPLVHPIVWPDWPSFERKLPLLGEPFFFAPGGGRAYWEIEYPKRTVLIFGREDAGLPADLGARFRDGIVSIPIISRQVRSLNLSTCVALALYEVLRQVRDAG